MTELKSLFCKRLTLYLREVLEIATVQRAGPVFIQLTDGRMFATLGGMGLNCTGCLVEATDEHRAALKNR